MALGVLFLVIGLTAAAGGFFSVRDGASLKGGQILKSENQSVKDLEKRFEFRTIREDEAGQAAQIEQACFPPQEACTEVMMRSVREKRRNCFWWRWIARRESWRVF